MNVEPYFTRKRTRSDGWNQDVCVGLATIAVAVHDGTTFADGTVGTLLYIGCGGHMLHSAGYPSRRDADSAAERMLPIVVERTRRCMSELLEPIE